MVEEEDEDQEEMLGKRTQRPDEANEAELQKQAKEEMYSQTVKQATESMKKKAAFAGIGLQEQEDMHMLQQLMRNNKRLAEEKAKAAAEKLKLLTQKHEEPTEHGEFVALEKVETPKNKHVDLKSIVEKAKQSEDPFKPPER